MNILKEMKEMGKDIGHDMKDAAKYVGKQAKKGAQNAYKETKKGVKKEWKHVKHEAKEAWKHPSKFVHVEDHHHHHGHHHHHESGVHAGISIGIGGSSFFSVGEPQHQHIVHEGQGLSRDSMFMDREREARMQDRGPNAPPPPPPPQHDVLRGGDYYAAMGAQDPASPVGQIEPLSADGQGGMSNFMDMLRQIFAQLFDSQPAATSPGVPDVAADGPAQVAPEVAEQKVAAGKPAVKQRSAGMGMS